MTTPARDGRATRNGDASLDHDALIAKLFALAARNGVEDLHAAGAFSDRQAPLLNRRVRGRIYEALLAGRYSRAGDGLFDKWLDDLAEGRKGGRSVAALQGAVGRGVDDFAAAEAIEPATATKLRDAAIDGATAAYRTVTRLSLGRSKDVEKDRAAVEFWLQSIPDYWEEPTLSPEFRAMLDSKRSAAS